MYVHMCAGVWEKPYIHTYVCELNDIKLVFLFLLLPSLPGLCYFMKGIVSRTDVAFMTLNCSFRQNNDFETCLM
jgi:hypothetical protein